MHTHARARTHTTTHTHTSTRLQELRLQRNYRSSGIIVEAARAVIQHNKMRCSKDPKAVAPPGEKIRVVECRNDTCEVRVGVCMYSHITLMCACTQ